MKNTIKDKPISFQQQLHNELAGIGLANTTVMSLTVAYSIAKKRQNPGATIVHSHGLKNDLEKDRVKKLCEELV